MGRSIHTPQQVALTTLLRQARDDAGLTQRELAKRLDRPQSFVSKYEAGERRLDLIELADICRALGIRLTSLVEQFEEAIGAEQKLSRRRRST